MNLGRMYGWSCDPWSRGSVKAERDRSRLTSHSNDRTLEATSGSHDTKRGFPTDRHRNERHRRSTDAPISIFPKIVWNSASEGRPHGIPKELRRGHWSKSYRYMVDDESLVVFFDNIQAFLQPS